MGISGNYAIWNVFIFGLLGLLCFGIECMSGWPAVLKGFIEQK